jgi:excisionase family DNA binding protein
MVSMTLLTIPRAAAQLGISRWTLRRAVEAHEVPALRRGVRWYVDVDQIAETMRGRLAAGAGR